MFSDFGHQGVFATFSDCKNTFYNENLKTSADSVWQEELWRKNNYLIAPEISTIFSLGGVSNNYNRENLGKILQSQTTVKSKLRILCKFFLQSILGQRRFYKIIYRKKYDLMTLE